MYIQTAARIHLQFGAESRANPVHRGSPPLQSRRIPPDRNRRGERDGRRFQNRHRRRPGFGLKSLKRVLFPYHTTHSMNDITSNVTKVSDDKEILRLKNINYQKKRRRSPEYRERQRLYFKKRRQDPEYKKRNKLYLQKRRKDPEYRKRQRDYDKAYRKRPDVIKKRAEKKALKHLDNLFKTKLVLE